jgi:hypothetical protein
MSRSNWTCCAFLIATVCVATALPSAAQERATLFPEPFVIEHRLVQTDADGSVFAAEPVTDTYAGSWIASERADGSRLIIDFARREMTEVQAASSTYSVIGFERYAELTRRYRALDDGAAAMAAKARVGEPVDLSVVEVQEVSAKDAAGTVVGKPRVRHLKVRRPSEAASDETVLEAWLDPDLRFSERALDSIDDFERTVLGATSADVPVSLQAVAMVRREAGGAVIVKTRRRLAAGGGAGAIEDVATRVGRVAAPAKNLMAVPDGFRQVPHPLELMVVHAEREAELNVVMGGGERP